MNASTVYCAHTYVLTCCNRRATYPTIFRIILLPSLSLYSWVMPDQLKLCWHHYMLNFLVEVYIDAWCHDESEINIRNSTWQWERIRLMVIICNIYSGIEEQIFSPYWVLYIEWMLHYLGRWTNPQSLLTEHVISFMGCKFIIQVHYTEMRGLEWLY